ncbi:hypothetical protein AXX12_18115 [Anaerosporomusa subterranea]|uniref:Uncharacterized protein n=1 Tax=Anaerosporomusa subterranea TaxID=1794912 RepID=A0A154BVX6_ANASB|nr:hypothetical protein [Anaerosporomusa subterranea]KYZ77648.1 hypothetical protein AXX12_18115 [Anaerosporomusa subterranea]
MATETADAPVSLWNTIFRITEKMVNDGASYDALINILTLFCLISILQRNTHSTSAVAAPSAVGGLGKLLGDLTKGDGTGPSPDALMSLLPLLNSPQMKSKLNPTTIATVLGLINSMGGGEKPESPKQEKAEPKGEPRALPVAPEAEEAPHIIPRDPAEKKTANSRYLNWKSSF